MIEIREPKTKEEFDSYYNLRWEILRKPWKQPKGSEKDELEDRSFHIIVLDNKKVVGVGRLHKNSDTECQIRYMAVDENYQGKGIGKAILIKLHEKAKESGLKKIVLNARKKAIGFYEKFGYKNLGKSHTLFGEIEHFKMQCILN